MVEHSLPNRPKTTTYLPENLPANLAFYHELDRYRHRSFLQRNLRAFFAYNAHRLQAEGYPASPTPSYQGSIKIEDLTKAFDAEGSLANGEENSAIPQADAVSRDTLLARTMDPDFEGKRRSARRVAQRIFDDDDSVLTLEPVSIRKKINFKNNRPPDDERPRKRVKSDRLVRRTKCHCSMTIWDNRDSLKEGAAALVETHNNCMATWSHTERYGYTVDIDMDKPFHIRAGALKVPVQQYGEIMLGISEKYFMEFKIWPSSKDAVWPPIPLLGKTDGDVNRPNRSAHTILSGSLVAKYTNMPKQPDADTPLSLFYLDQEGMMHRTKYGLELSGDWRASDAAINLDLPPNNLAWAVNDDDSFLGRTKKRSRAASSPRQPPRPLKQAKRAPRAPMWQPSIAYIWEAPPNQKHLAQDEFQKTIFEGFVCPACPLFTAQNLKELRAHFLTTHDQFNFNLNHWACDLDLETGGTPCNGLFRVTSIAPSQQQSRISKEFLYLASSDPYDLNRYLNGQSSFNGGSPASAYKSQVRTLIGPSSSSVRAPNGALKTRIPGFVEDPLVAIRAGNNGHLPPDSVPDFRKAERRKHKPTSLIRLSGDNQTLSYDSISRRPTYPSESEMSETDDEHNGEWYIQRHLETLTVDADFYGRSDAKQELFRRWDRHRLEEKLDNIAFLSESLVRFVRKHKSWLRSGETLLITAWNRLIDNLLEDKLIDRKVSDNLLVLIFAANDQELDLVNAGTGVVKASSEDQRDGRGSRSRSQTSHLGDAVGLDADESSEFSKTAAALKLTLKLLSDKLRLTRPEHCGVCQDYVENQPQAVRCTAQKCLNSDILYHPKCVRRRKRKQMPDSEWSCLVCQTEARLDAERKACLGKGKATG